jgi:hypothetical protein
MDAANFSQQTNEVVELALDEIESVSGGFPTVPPPQKPGG